MTGNFSKAAAAIGALALAFAAAPGRADERTPLRVDAYKPDLVYPGTTVFVDATRTHQPRIVEIDFHGNVVWSYDVPASVVAGGPPNAAADAVTDVKWVPGVDHFLFVITSSGVYEVDRAKAVTWSYRTRYASHSVARARNGDTLFTWAWDGREDAQVTEVDPSGQVVWQWFAAKALPHEFAREPGRKDAQAMIAKTKAGGGGKDAGIAMIQGEGFTHANAVERLPNGDTMVSLRNLSRIVEVNPAGTVVWSYDHANGTHLPEVLANGNVLVNHPGTDMVVEVTRDGRPVWHFATERYGGGNRYAHRLPNGNTLIATHNHLLEVTPSGEIAWQVTMLAMGGGQSRREMANYTNFDTPEQVLYSAGRIPPRNSPDWSQWWDDPANRPATVAGAARPGRMAAAGAPPGRPAAGGGALFARFDLDGDGIVTEPEFLAARRAIMQQMDGDHDGVITREEFEAHAPPQMPPQMRTMIFTHLDTNADGRLSQDEIDAAAREVFHRLDRRHDGKLTADGFAGFPAPPPILLFGVPPGGAPGPAAGGSAGAGGAPPQQSLRPPGR